MFVHKGHSHRWRGVVAASVVALLAAAPVLAADAEPAAARYVPTMADYLGVYDALQRYRFGLEKHDQKLQDSAYWEAPKPRGPPPGVVPSPGSNAEPAGEIWHLPLDSYVSFQSATRATHYGYFLSIYPQPEKPRAEGATGNMQNSRTSIVGWPGHYEDILEKRNGEWRILERKTKVNEK